MINLNLKKMKTIICIFLIGIFSSCHSQNDDINIIQDYIAATTSSDQILSYLNTNKISKNEVMSIYLSGLHNEKDKKNVNLSKWPFNINTLKTITSNNNTTVWKDEELSLRVLKENDSLVTVAKKIMKKEASLFSLSNVYFDTEKVYALIAIEQTHAINVAEKFVVILKKQGNHWKVINKISDTTLH